jgi:hypothetical protein
VTVGTGAVQAPPPTGGGGGPNGFGGGGGAGPNGFGGGGGGPNGFGGGGESPVLGQVAAAWLTAAVIPTRLSVLAQYCCIGSSTVAHCCEQVVGMSPLPGAHAPFGQHAVVTKSEKAMNSRYVAQFVGICCANAPSIAPPISSKIAADLTIAPLDV